MKAPTTTIPKSRRTPALIARLESLSSPCWCATRPPGSRAFWFRVQQPASAERLIERHDRLQAGEAHLREQILLGEQGLLDLDQSGEIEGSLAKFLLRQIERLVGFRHRPPLQHLLQGQLLDADQR